MYQYSYLVKRFLFDAHFSNTWRQVQISLKPTHSVLQRLLRLTLIWNMWYVNIYMFNRNKELNMKF